MISVSIPGFGNVRLEHLVLDYNGTIAKDGILLDGVAELFRRLSDQLDIHVITADTFGSARKELAGLPVKIQIIGKDSQDVQKQNFIESLGPEKCAAVGNGRNDSGMLKTARIGIVTMQSEGASVKALMNGDIAVNRIHDALELLLNPKRLTATLRF